MRNGLITTEKALADYGVAIDPATFAVDHQRSQRLRAGRAGRPAPEAEP